MPCRPHKEKILIVGQQQGSAKDVWTRVGHEQRFIAYATLTIRKLEHRTSTLILSILNGQVYESLEMVGVPILRGYQQYAAVLWHRETCDLPCKEHLLLLWMSILQMFDATEGAERA